MEVDRLRQCKQDEGRSKNELFFIRKRKGFGKPEELGLLRNIVRRESQAVKENRMLDLIQRKGKVSDSTNPALQSALHDDSEGLALQPRLSGIETTRQDHRAPPRKTSLNARAALPESTAQPSQPDGASREFALVLRSIHRTTLPNNSTQSKETTPGLRESLHLRLPPLKRGLTNRD